MATYCFASPDERRRLFGEVAVRGYQAGIRDFPRFKSWDESAVIARAESEILRSEVCCILSEYDEDAYYQLVTSAYCNFYVMATEAHQAVGERLVTVSAALAKQMSVDEAVRLTRPLFDRNEVQAVINGLYARYLAATVY